MIKKENVVAQVKIFLVTCSKNKSIFLFGPSPNLLVRDILNLIVIDWSHFLKARLVDNINVVLYNPCQKYSDVFSSGSGHDEGSGSTY